MFVAGLTRFNHLTEGEMNRIAQVVSITIGVLLSKGYLSDKFGPTDQEKIKEVIDGVNLTLEALDRMEAK